MPIPYIIGAAAIYGAYKAYEFFSGDDDEEHAPPAQQKKESPIVELEKKRMERVNGWKKEFFEAWVQALLRELPKQYEQNAKRFFVPLRNSELIGRSPISDEECFLIMKKAVRVACDKIGLDAKHSLRFSISATDTISGDLRYPS